MALSIDLRSREFRFERSFLWEVEFLYLPASNEHVLLLNGESTGSFDPYLMIHLSQPERWIRETLAKGMDAQIDRALDEMVAAEARWIGQTVRGPECC
jgi:hypothetical protein